MMSVVMAMFINDTSQFETIEDIEGNCKKYWWRNLLFIQTFYPKEELVRDYLLRRNLIVN